MRFFAPAVNSTARQKVTSFVSRKSRPKRAQHGKVLRQGKSKKVSVVKFKRRQNYLRQGSHRQFFTEVEITAIGGSAKSQGDKKKAAAPKKEAAVVEKAAPKKKAAAKKTTTKKAAPKKAAPKKAAAKKTATKKPPSGDKPAAKKKAAKKD